MKTVHFDDRVGRSSLDDRVTLFQQLLLGRKALRGNALKGEGVKGEGVKGEGVKGKAFKGKSVQRGRR